MRLASLSDHLDKTREKLLINALIDLEHLISSLERKGLPFREFLALKNEEGAFPRYQVYVDNRPHYVYSEEEFHGLKERYIAEETKKQ